MRTGVSRASSLLSIAILIAVLGRPLLAQKGAQTPSEFYLSYCAAAEKMKSFRDIVPYMPADQAAMFAKIPKEMEKELLDDAKKEIVTGVKVTKESPYQDGFLLSLEGTKKATGKRTMGWAKIVKEGGALKLAKDDWTGVPPPAAPKIPATVAEMGKAVGELTVDGQTAKLLYATATAGPDSFNKAKTAYEVTLSDVPWNPKDYNQSDKVKAGTLHYLVLSIGSDQRIDGTMLHHKAFDNGSLSSAGAGHNFEPEKVGPDFVAGRAYLEGPQKPMGQTFYYAVTFRAPVVKAPGK